jgi:predicted dehydrogenase
MHLKPDRRTFLAGLGAAGAALATMGATSPTTRPRSKNSDAIVVGMIGTGGRGTELAGSYAGMSDVIVHTVCDVDATHAKAGADAAERKQGTRPKIVDDLRHVLDDPAIQAVVIATPDHWHAPAAILACEAGKHVYVEKPCCHNPQEGQWLIEAARKHDRVVQQGTQRRSWPGNREAIERVLAGDIGKAYLSRGWYNNNRPMTGRRTPASVPPGLNWDLWQGPAPRCDFTDNVVPYKWHWYWNWGTGEIGNNGIHALDLCRWGLGVDYPRKVTAGGGRYHFHDDQQTPDTLSVTYNFGDKAIFWEGRSCNPVGFEDMGFGIEFYGDKATLIVDGGGYRINDLKGKLLHKQTGVANNEVHIQNFIDCIRSGQRPNADIEIGFKSTLLCHLGNIAYRTGGVVNCDPATGQILGHPAARALWGRTYEPQWKPKV